jgi:hypothetical protein
MKTAGTTLTTWSNGSQTQSLPAYCGVQEIYSSTNWVYVRSTGLASYNMGPWQNGAFPNLPVNQKNCFTVFRARTACRRPKPINGGGQIGIFVDGVAMFNSWDAYTLEPRTTPEQNITGYWNRDAYVNEGATFDAGYAHQQNTGTYHYHADPIALRYLLGDHVDYNPGDKNYSEDTNTPTQHSPILGVDGGRLSALRALRLFQRDQRQQRHPADGFRLRVMRNGQDGTEQSDRDGRTTIPQWAVRLFTASAQTRPARTSAPITRWAVTWRTTIISATNRARITAGRGF